MDQGASPPPQTERSRSTSLNPIDTRVLRIVPRTKTDKGRRIKRTVQSVEVTVNTIRNLSSYSEVAAAASLGISVTALKHACRTLGFEKWPRQGTEHLDGDVNKDKSKTSFRAASGPGNSASGKTAEPSLSARPVQDAAKKTPIIKSSRSTLELAAPNANLEDMSDDSATALSEPFDLNDAATQASSISAHSAASSLTAACYYTGTQAAPPSSLAKSSLWKSEKYEPNPAFHGRDGPVVGVGGSKERQADSERIQDDLQKPSTSASSVMASTFSFPSHLAWHTTATPNATQVGFPALPPSSRNQPSQLASQSECQPLEIAGQRIVAPLGAMHSVTSVFLESQAQNSCTVPTSHASTAQEDQEMNDDWSPPKLSVNDAATLYHSLGGESWLSEASPMDAWGDTDLERHIFLSARLAREQRLWNLHVQDEDSAVVDC